MITPADKASEKKSQSVANAVFQKQSSGESAIQFVDNRPEFMAQRKLQEMADHRQRVKPRTTFQEMADNYAVPQPHQGLQKLEGAHDAPRSEGRTAMLRFIPARAHTTTPAVAQGRGVVQAKMFFVPNKHYLADPDQISVNQVDQYQQQFITAVSALADNANADAARGAVNASFAGLPLGGLYQLNWAANRVFLVKGPNYPGGGAGERLEDLGAVTHDQDANLYVAHPVAGGGNIHVNRSDRSQSVQDSSGQYTERFVGRSLAEPDLINLQGQHELRGPNLADRTTLDHVTGINDGDFLSFSTDPNDVMNAHGVMFNAAQRGRVVVDLARMAAARINNLSTRAGIRANLRPQMGLYGRNNLDQIMNQGEARANAERLAGPAPALVAGDAEGVRRTAGQNNPHNNNNLPNIHYQAIADAFRTKEVLLEGAVPFNAITSYNANAAPHAVGAPVTNAIAGNLAASQALTHGADQALTNAEQMPVVVLTGPYLGEIIWLQGQLNPLGQARYNAARLTGDAPNKDARNQQFRESIIAEGQRMRDEGREITEIYQRRSVGGWANSLPANLRARLQQIVNDAPANFAGIAPPL